MKKQCMVVLVDNNAGVLARISSLFVQRGFNIDSLTVSSTDDPKISRITVTTTGDARTFSQIMKQTAKLTEVAANSLDSIVSESNAPRIDYIKFDVEGAEKEALEGCYKTIERFAPSLLISLYHRSEDIFALPLQLIEKFPDYKFYLRKFKYVPAWDLNLYAVKK